MIPLRVELTNFLSFGEPAQTFEFTDDEPLWVLCGPNGVGKSAVFDAMTFALFGEHRGGSQHTDELIRHGASSFRVLFEFEFNHTRYSVERGRNRRSPIQRVRRESGEGWEDIDLSAYSGRDRIRGWAEATLGLNFEAFSSSVMLRQGEADRIIMAAPRERLDILRRIIGAERYERLYDQVQGASRGLRTRLDALNMERDRIPDVTTEQLEESAKELEQAAIRLRCAGEARDAATVRVEQARQWNTLEQQRHRLAEQLREADTRAEERERICAEHARFEELGRALPTARELVQLRDQLQRLEAESLRMQEELANATEARNEAERLAAEAQERARASHQQVQDSQRDRERLRNAIVQAQRHVAQAEKIASLEEEERRFPVDLDLCRMTSEREVQRFTQARSDAGERRAVAAAQLQAAEHRYREFGSVEIGVPCSRCGQPVSEEHARRERRELEEEVARHRAARDSAQVEQEEARAALEAATAERDRLVRESGSRDRVRQGLEIQRQNLQSQGVSPNADALRVELTRLQQDLQTVELAAGAASDEHRRAQTEATQHDTARKLHNDRAATLERQLNSTRTEHARGSARRDVLLGQLSESWRNRLPTLTSRDIECDQAELGELQRADIAAHYRQLSEDAARRDEWERQCARLLSEMELIPVAAQCSMAEADQACAEAKNQFACAESAHGAVRDQNVQLRRDFDQRRIVLDQFQQLERSHQLHGRLADLLGPNGLQRELVRTAEREIVRHANDTVQNISCGDLAIELDETEEGPDRAFALRVRRADDPTPIGVRFLSGSQKFRVAVAVALAIGRFASGQSRPLESVIIDEGFGSLDRDGLQAMGEELSNLQQSQLLRRLILVSHQEDFTARFPVGYRLQAGESGTTATRFRREGGENV